MRITVRIHEHYVQTSVRVATGGVLKYVEYGSGNLEIPLNVFCAESEMDVLRLMQNSVEFFDTWGEAFPLEGLQCVFEISYIRNFDTGDITVVEARHILLSYGMTNVEKIFKNELIKKQALTNLFQALADRNVEAVDKACNAMRKMAKL